MSATVPPDIEIAQSATLRPITDVATELNLAETDLIRFGDSKAKIKLTAREGKKRTGKLVLITGISPTAAGEGKSTVAVGITQAFRKLEKSAVVCLREPSLGPVFGIKGGAAGGGHSQVIPMEDINLHFTGDFHAISSAHNLLAAMLDNHVHQSNPLDIDTRRITWPRAIDMNDRALRSIVVGLGGPLGGVPREDKFVITAASEIMAVVALARDMDDLENRIGNIIVAATHNRDPVTARQLNAHGAMTLLLKDALMPNLVQTLEGGPALIHCGPFANIAHGCNSVIATDMALRLADIVVTEAGFGSDLGAEKFFDIKCRSADLEPDAAVIVATVRALKLHGGVAKQDLAIPDPEAVRRGAANLERHISVVRKFGVPVVVSVNCFITDTEDEIAVVHDICRTKGVEAIRTEVWEKGGEGGVDLALKVLEVLKNSKPKFRPLYELGLEPREKIETVAREIYGAGDVEFTPAAERGLKQLAAFDLNEVPVCVAKTQYSFSDNPELLGAPSGFRLHVREVYPSAGAGFIVALAGNIMTMPGLSKSPAAERMRLDMSGHIEGLF